MRGKAKARALKDNIRLGERIGEVFGVVISLFVFLFLYANQLRGVPFFTSSFGGEAQFFFYAPLFVGMALSLGRVVYGHRNGLRPFDSLNALFLAVASFWLLSVFLVVDQRHRPRSFRPGRTHIAYQFRLYCVPLFVR